MLEDRLPPGDVLLGIGMTLSSFASDRAAGTHEVVGHRQFGGLNCDEGDDTANLSIFAGDLGLARDSAQSAVRLEPSHAAVERTAGLSDLMAWRPVGHTVWSPAASNADGALLLRGSLPVEAVAWDHALIALPASSVEQTLLSAVQTGMSVPLEFLQAPPSNSRALAVSGQAPLAFDPASGWLAIWGGGGGDRIGETITPGGFLDVTLGGQSHSSDPASARFDPALAGASRETLSGIRVEGGRGQETTPEQGGQETTPEQGGQETTPEQGVPPALGRGLLTTAAPLALASQTVAHGLTVQTDGPVDVTGAVQSQGPITINASTIAVHARLQGATVDLSSPGLVNVAAKGSVAAEGIGVTAGVFIAAGQLRADGVHGGQIGIQAGNMLQGGRISADGTTADGGTVEVHFRGSYIATAAAVTSADGVHGGQVTIEGGTTGQLFSSGIQEALGRSAVGGSVALSGRGVTRVAATADASGEARTAGFHLVDPHPTRAGTFGFQITPLSNGNLVVTNPHDNFVAPDSGAVYLMEGRTGALLGALVGSMIGDRLGDDGDPGGDGPLGPGPVGPVGSGVVSLMNGNYAVISPGWSGNRGAVTWGSGTAGITGTVDASNSLVGSDPGDGVGSVTALSNGNYVVLSRNWNGGRGAATWGDGTTGITGTVDASNSLVGSNPRDFLLGSVTALSNGNYVVSSRSWNGGRGAATWGDGTIGVTGTMDASNSLVGSDPGDGVGSVTALSNGNYVVSSYSWNGLRGAATWGDGTIGVTGTVDASNSLVGSNPGDGVGSHGATALSNGNYVVRSLSWNGNRGAVTWGDGTAGVTGTVDASNSLVGSNPGDYVGSHVVALNNGNYVVSSPAWNGYRGAATWGDGTIGVTGTVDADNSLVGSDPGEVMRPNIVELSNGNYVVSSIHWNGNRGAVTWGDGTTGVSGTVDASNSLVGSNPGDYVGSVMVALSNGNYVVRSPWNGGRGAATWGDGTIGVTGTVDANNSLVGSNPGDGVGSVTALSNGNYVVSSYSWNGNRGAATWGDGTIGVTGTVDASNSLVGSDPGDGVGSDVVALNNGNYVVSSPSWNGRRGAVTWGDGTMGITGEVDENNSLVGANSGDLVGFSYFGGRGITALSNGNYVVGSPAWNGRRGAATWGDGTIGVTGTVDASNSLVGSNPNDAVGARIAALSNSNYVVASPSWNGNRGAATWGDGTVGITGEVDENNSLVGSNPGNSCGPPSSGDCVGYGTSGFDGITALNNGNYVVLSPYWNGNRGAVTWGDGTMGITGEVNENNSLVG
jgi:hypothetical protein